LLDHRARLGGAGEGLFRLLFLLSSTIGAVHTSRVLTVLARYHMLDPTERIWNPSEPNAKAVARSKN
jgi:hypothetical protein